MAQAAVFSPGAGLDPFFNARSIVVIGASDDPTKIGGRPVHLLRKHGFAGAIYPVNPKGGSIQELPAYTSVLDTPARRAFWRRLFTHMGVRTHAGGTADRVHAQREHDLLLDGPPAS